jgi:hypothetical protein
MKAFEGDIVCVCVCVCVCVYVYIYIYIYIYIYMLLIPVTNLPNCSECHGLFLVIL